MLTEVPGGQPLAMSASIWSTIKDINDSLQNVRNSAQNLASQDRTMQALTTIETLGVSKINDEGKSKEDKDAELLEKVEGLGWSKFVFEEIEWRLEDARADLISLAKQNSQWRSLIQTVFILLASISVGLVWIKLNNVA